jgi:DNA polymerase-3 subunit delta'
MPYRDVAGHRRVVHLLARSVHRGSLPPSLIFAGPEGVGKRLVALATAQALNCQSPVRLKPDPTPEPDATPEQDACGVCAACTRIERGIHPDVVIVEPGDTGSIKIDQVRDIIDRAAYRPFEGRRRAVIIDQADALLPAAQNALLKTLEEPPSTSIFMLVTARPDMLLPTVQSRCPKLRFRPLGPDEVAAVLVKKGRTAAEARAIGAAAGGSVGQALDASGGDMVAARDQAVRVLTQAAATADPRRRLDSAKNLAAKSSGGPSAAADREALSAALRAMASIVRDVELLSTRSNDVPVANADVEAELERLSAFRGDRGVRAFAAIDTALTALDGNAGVKVVADWVVLQL